MSLADWADTSSTAYTTIQKRLEAGWDVKRAITESLRTRVKL